MKTYEYGFQTGYGEDSIDVTNIKKEDSMKIFEASKKVLMSDEKGHYQYRTDGLIFLPTNLSVKGEVEGVQKDSIRGTSGFKIINETPH